MVDALASRWNVALDREKFHGWFALGDLGGERVALIKPTTFMNRSGRAVQAAGRFYKLELDQLLVISDDLALPVGRIRLRAGGSSGGHKGLQDTVDRLASDEWARLRVGIGGAIGEPTAYVLGRFDQEDETVMTKVRERAADAAECWIRDGIDLAMTRFNGDVSLA